MSILLTHHFIKKSQARKARKKADKSKIRAANKQWDGALEIHTYVHRDNLTDKNAVVPCKALMLYNIKSMNVDNPLLSIAVISLNVITVISYNCSRYMIA